MSSHGFRFAIAFVLRQEDTREDAQAVDIGDGAGLTKWGLTQKHHPDVDIQNLTFAGMVDIYERRYWQAVRSDLVAMPLGVCLFDGAVNHGPPTAVTLLQRAVGVPEDGVLGPVTAAASRNVARVLRRFCAMRGMRYREHPDWQKWGAGWEERLLEVYAYCLGLPD